MQQGRPQGPDARMEIHVTLEEMYIGAERSIPLQRNVICKKCRGTGSKGSDTKKCKTCGGRGVVLVNQQMAPGYVHIYVY